MPWLSSWIARLFNAEYLRVFKVSLPITPLLVPASAVTMEYVVYKAYTVNCSFDCSWHEWQITCCLHLLYSDRIMTFSIELLFLVLEMIWNSHRVSRTILYRKFICAEDISILKFIAGWLVGCVIVKKNVLYLSLRKFDWVLHFWKHKKSIL